MKKLMKWIMAIVAVVVVLLLVATLVLPMVVDPNDYKDEISAAVTKKTGRDLTIGGDIKWSVFPSIGLELSDVTLGNPNGFGEQPMLDIGEAGVSVKFLPLLKRQVEVIRLQRIQLRVTAATGPHTTQCRRRARITGTGIDEHIAQLRTRDGFTHRRAYLDVVGEIQRNVEVWHNVVIVVFLRHRGCVAESRCEVVIRCPVLGYWNRLHR